jgi:hypothetical protein
MTNQGGGRASRWATGLLVCIAIGGALLGGMWAVLGGREQAGVLALDARHMPLEISGPEEFERLRLGLRSYQYRAKHTDGTSVRESYYDTADWALGRRGYAYVLSRSLGDDGAPAYSLRLSGVEAGRRFEIADDVPASIGDAISAGAWEQGLPGRVGLASGRRLGALLDALEVREEDLAVRGIADVAIEHFDVSDKGHIWFELDYEEWVFSGRDAEAEGMEPFRWYGITLLPGEGPEDQEFRERVHQMERVLPTFYGFRPDARPRLERALEALGHG